MHPDAQESEDLVNTKEFVSRVWAARHELYRTAGRPENFSVWVNHETWENLMIERDDYFVVYRPNHPTGERYVFGMRVDIDPRLGDDEVVLRAEVVA